MLPFQIIGEFSRTLALAMRLFGNIMSGNLITAILLSIVPLFVPVLMQILGLVFGVIQAYVFAVLALVYISSSAATIRRRQPSALGGPSHE
jgi:F-type H+-transporting ATPase subunit a